MNREDIFRMAQEVELINKDYDLAFLNKYTDKVERFAALVASAERESLRESFRVVTAAEASAAILHEREACAEICDGFYLSWIDIQGRYEFMGEGASECAGAIRARGQA